MLYRTNIATYIVQCKIMFYDKNITLFKTFKFWAVIFVTLGIKSF